MKCACETCRVILSCPEMFAIFTALHSIAALQGKSCHEHCLYIVTPGPWISRCEDDHSSSPFICNLHASIDVCGCAQIIECGGKENQVFTRSNPWISAILALAAEVYAVDGLKLTHKFEVEKLFRLFDISLNAYKSSDTLSCHVRNPVDNQDFYGAERSGSQAVPSPVQPDRIQPPPTPAPQEQQQQQAAAPTPQPPQRPFIEPPGTF